MHSKDLPTTEWWDPEWDVYDVPLSPFDDGVDHDTWWAAYQHLWLLRHIMEGTAEYIPFHYQHQLTTGAENWCFECEDVHPPGHHTDPEPCCCTYRLYTSTVALTAGYGPHRSRVVLVLGSYFTINARCVHHGDYLVEDWQAYPWALPWETTLGPDETQP